ncbi:MAG TPA: hypothetical protein VFH47_04035 [Candidatus Thermoplasmatota archaeon]|nr:hypothetical protein [Candidatus Thermoplasmatota archaeon]
MVDVGVVSGAAAGGREVLQCAACGGAGPMWVEGKHKDASRTLLLEGADGRFGARVAAAHGHVDWDSQTCSQSFGLGGRVTKDWACKSIAAADALVARADFVDAAARNGRSQEMLEGPRDCWELNHSRVG